MASLPSLDRLSLQPGRAVVATGTLGLNDLPPDLLEALMEAVEGEEPCEEIVKLCSLNRRWAALCRTDWFYDAANRALGYYGEFHSFEEVVTEITDEEGNPPASAKEYFKAACNSYFDESDMLDEESRDIPWFEARLLQQIRSGGYALSFRKVPTDLSNYGAIAKAEVRSFPEHLKYVPKDRADYGEIAKVAVQKNGQALEHVPKDRADYGEIAKRAVQRDGYALKYVSRGRADFIDLARLAVQQDADVLEILDDHHWRSGYFGIAELAVKQDGRLLEHVPSNIDGFAYLAKIAVKQNPMALEFVPIDNAHFAELAEVAVKKNWRVLADERIMFQDNPLFPLGTHDAQMRLLDVALRKTTCADLLHYVYRENPEGDYYYLAMLCANRDGEALRWVPDDVEDYDEIVLAAVEQNGMALRWAKDNLNANRELVMAAVKQNGMALKFADRQYNADREIVMAAVRQNGKALVYAVNELRQDPAIAFVARGMKLRLS